MELKEIVKWMIQVRDELTKLQKGFALNMPQSIDHDKMINMY